MKTRASLRVSQDTQATNNQRLAMVACARVERLEGHECVARCVASRRSATARQVDR
jgi:hypothetical protein